MPKFSESQASRVDTSLPSNPIVSATDLCQHRSVIQFYDKRTAKTEFGESMFVDFMYADDPYTPEGYREQHYTTVFTVNSPAYKQLQAVELNYNDPLECVILAAGRSFKLGDADAPQEAPTSAREATSARPAQGASRPAANAATPSPARTSTASRPTPRQPINAGKVTLGDDAEELPF